MASQNDSVQLNEADIAFLLTLLRDAEGPRTTAELVEALKSRKA
jgi:predicted transcriptional regulator